MVFKIHRDIIPKSKLIKLNQLADLKYNKIMNVNLLAKTLYTYQPI